MRTHPVTLLTHQYMPVQPASVRRLLQPVASNVCVDALAVQSNPFLFLQHNTKSTASIVSSVPAKPKEHEFSWEVHCITTLIQERGAEVSAESRLLNPVARLFGFVRGDGVSCRVRPDQLLDDLFQPVADL